MGFHMSKGNSPSHAVNLAGRYPYQGQGSASSCNHFPGKWCCHVLREMVLSMKNHIIHFYLRTWRPGNKLGTKLLLFKDGVGGWGHLKSEKETLLLKYRGCWYNVGYKNGAQRGTALAQILAVGWLPLIPSYAQKFAALVWNRMENRQPRRKNTAALLYRSRRLGMIWRQRAGKEVCKGAVNWGNK